MADGYGLRINQKVGASFASRCPCTRQVSPSLSPLRRQNYLVYAQRNGDVMSYTQQHILLVDDDPGILMAVKHALVAHGYEVTTATNGIEALAAFKRKPPELILLIRSTSSPYHVSGID